MFTPYSAEAHKTLLLWTARTYYKGAWVALTDRVVAGFRYAKDNRRYGFVPYAAVFCFHRRFGGLIAEITWKVGKLEIICEWSKRLYRTKGEKL